MPATKRQQRQAAERSRHLEKLERRLQETIAVSVSFMSNTKWGKALRAIARSESDVSGTAWKFLNEDEVVTENCAPMADEILESHLSDATFYYVGYRYIEWLDVMTDQSDLLAKELSTSGRFEIEIESGRIRLYGYRPVT